jgi:hypothetical protein
MKLTVAALAALLVFMLVGCNSTSRSYTVMVKNEATRPVTLWLTKDGPPAEEGWLTPEQIVNHNRELRYDLAFVPPGRVGITDKMSGEFPQGTHAVLRVYEGEKEVYDLAKAGPSHSDYPLKPGTNRLRVTERDGQLVVER